MERYLSLVVVWLALVGSVGRAGLVTLQTGEPGLAKTQRTLRRGMVMVLLLALLAS